MSHGSRMGKGGKWEAVLGLCSVVLYVTDLRKGLTCIGRVKWVQDCAALWMGWMPMTWMRWGFGGEYCIVYASVGEKMEEPAIERHQINPTSTNMPVELQLSRKGG
jgi:hypothetical protein